jgi:TRAP-type mannitol/chloroaromatic compound transport system substrate-binding protein
MGSKLARAMMAAVLGIGQVAGPVVDAAVGAERVEWRMQSAFPSDLSIIGEVASRFEGLIERLSGGALAIELFEPGALVPPLEIFDAVRAGAVEAGWSTPGFHAGKIPALVWFSSVPFGPRAGEYLAWLRYGGGDEIYAEHGLKGLHCGLVTAEASGWFRDEITSPEQFT